MEEEIKAEFNKSGFSLDDEEEILKKCLAFCINYNLKPSDLVSSWEVYYLNRQLDESVVRNGEMDGFLLHLQNEQKEMVIKEEPNLHVYSSKDVEMILKDEEGDAKEEIPSTPGDKSLKLQWESSDSALKPHGSAYSSVKSKLVTPFGRRAEKLVEKLSISNLSDSENGDNENVQEISEDDIIKRVQQRKRCSLTVNGSGPEPGSRFMYDRIEDRFNALDNRIKKHATALSASGFYEEPTDPTVASQRNVFTVGMICCDGEGRLNDKSILLQSSSELSGGRNVRLDLTKLSQFSIFPGQIVGIEGQNPSGHCFIASKLVASVPLSDCGDGNLPPAKRQAFDQEFQSADLSSAQDQTLSVLIASGPFTTSDNLLFEPFKELLAYGSRKLPQLLILLGPFVDSDHPEINKGTTDRSFEDIFHLEIIKRLQEHVEYIGSDARVLLVPSIRDAHHDFVFPQPAFDIDLPNLKHQVISLTNPGSFEANQVKVGCCSVDILKQLSGEEMSRNPADGIPSDRMSRIASHILSQQSFYPLYPPSEHIPLDFSLAPEALHITSIPDILILPSDMKYFIKVLTLGEGEKQRKCVCVNPGRLAKGEGGGTFAELHYHGSPDKMNASIMGI